MAKYQELTVPFLRYQRLFIAIMAEILKRHPDVKIRIVDSFRMISEGFAFLVK